MASKKAGRLAGLAALAGLAYMNKDKFGAKGATKDAGKSETKETPAPDRDDSERVIGSRVRKDDDITVAGKGGFDASADMSSSPRVGTPARTASSVKAPSASVTKMPEGAFPGRRSDIVGGGRSGGRGGPEAGEEAAYRARDAKQAELMSSYKPRNPGMKMRDVTFNRSGNVTQYSNKGLRDRGAEEREDTSILNSKENKDELSDMSMKRGGKVKKMASGGMASKRGDGIASKGKTRCKMY